MTELIFKLLGGIGLFLLGMVLLTDGLKAFAGDALRRALMRFTGTPTKAFGSGALVTMMMQSSSATTVAVIGFVSAGLLAFPQAVGVVMGASLGTTATGWIVSGLGLKVNVGFYTLPLVGIGAFLKLLGRGRWRALGPALAGFGLIFIGIDTLQEAMRGLSSVFNLAGLPAKGTLGHLIALAIGILLTLVMQSSSAAVATTLTALHTGALNFDQAASLVIGAAIGTTVTGVLAAIGGGVPAKRTAVAHVSFNLVTGLIAVVLLPVFLRGIVWAQQHLGLEPGAMSLAAFHTTFIAVGVAIFLPFAGRFAALIERWVPDKGPPLTRHLDKTLLQAPPAALEASRRALCDTATDLFAALQASLQPSGLVPGEREAAIGKALERLQEYLPQIPAMVEDTPLSHLRIGQMHALEHLSRLRLRLEPPPSIRRVLNDPVTVEAVGAANRILEMGQQVLAGGGSLAAMEAESARLTQFRDLQRPLILERTAGGSSDPASALDLLDAIRWCERIGHHAWRICHHLNRAGSNPGG